MRTSLRSTLGHVLFLLLVLIPAWAPLTRPGLPQWRVGALPVLKLYAWERGETFAITPMPDTWFSYLIARGMRWFGVDGVLAIKLGLGLGLILVALSIFWGLRRLWGPHAGILAAMLVVYSPFVLGAIYLEGTLAGVWLLLGISFWAWAPSISGWRRWIAVGLGVVLVLANLFPMTPTAPFSPYRLFESPWFWGDASLHIPMPTIWSPGYPILALTMVAVWLVYLRGNPPASWHKQDRWAFSQIFLTGVIFGVLLLFPGEGQYMGMFFVVMTWALAGVSVLAWFPRLKQPALWAGLLALPLLAAGPTLSPDFQTYPIPERPAGIFGPQQILLIDVSADGAPTPGQTWTLNAYWQGTQPIDFDYNLFIHVLDDQGQWVTQLDVQPMPDKPMTTWVPGQVHAATYRLEIPADARGPFHVRLGLYNWQSGQRLTLPDGSDAITLHF